MPMRHPLLLALAVAGLLGSFDADAQKLYRWVDKDGVVRYSDQVPPEAVNEERQTLDRRGMTVDRVERAMTPEERAEHERALAEQARLAQQEEEQRKSDAILLGSYQSEADLERTYKERFALAAQSLEAAQIGIASQEKSMAEFLAHAADLERNGKPINDKLKQSIETARRQVTQQREQLAKREAEQAALQREYFLTLERYRSLKGDAAASE
jgi:hypothetical protein